MAVNADLDWAIEDVRRRLHDYRLFIDYDQGRHRLLFATDKFKNTFGSLFQEFADNVCDDVVDAITDRLQITGWSSTDKALNAAADDVWERNQGEARSGAVHRNGFREGDGFTIAQTDSQGVTRIYRQRPTQMAVRYNAERPDEMDLAAKVWKDVARKRYRVNIYYPDRVEKFASRGLGADGGLPKAAAFVPLQAGDPGLMEADSYVSENTVEGIPVFHYPNGELSEYGRSILAGVIPLQDAFNKSIADLLVTMEGRALPERWATGIQVEVDPFTGEEKDPFKNRGPGSMYRTGNKEASFGEFSAADVSPFLDVADFFKIEAARKGAMAPFAMPTRQGVDVPSGIALLVAEGRTVKLAKDRQRDWGTEHKREMAYSLNLELGRQDVTPEDLDLNWAPPETRDMKALLEELTLKKDLGVPTRQILLEAGYSTDEVDDFLDEAADEQAGQDAAMYVLQGGRNGVAPGAAQTLNGALGVPAGPVPPGGGQTAMAGA